MSDSFILALFAAMRERANQKGRTKEQKKVIKYFTETGCLSSSMTDDAYDALIATRMQAFDYKKKALYSLGIDESQVSEIPPVCFHGYVFEDPRLEANNIEIRTKRGADEEWRSSAYMITWIFFGDDEVYYYQEVFCMDSFCGWSMTDEFFYKDIVNFYTVTSLTEDLLIRGCLGRNSVRIQRATHSFAIAVPDQQKLCTLDLTERNLAIVQGMKNKLRDKKMQ